jgi:nucleotide-binding universal stress UspA family protein
MAAVRRIVYFTDYSPASRPALRKAIELAKALHRELALVHVLSPVIIPVISADMYLPPATYDELQRTSRATAERHIQRLAAQARRAGIRVSHRLVEGTPVADEIVRTARALRADLLVVGTHGRTGVTRAVLGSVAARVVATATCPVLTVRGSAR